jgi:hypothetical protein
MTYTNHTLRFKDEDEFKAVWPYMHEDEAYYPNPSALRVIGVTFRNDMPEVPRKGFLVNLNLPDGIALHEALVGFEIPAPENPAEVWA